MQHIIYCNDKKACLNLLIKNQPLGLKVVVIEETLIHSVCFICLCIYSDRQQKSDFVFLFFFAYPNQITK